MSQYLIINLCGGLGNQLFMLFAGISNALDNNKSFFIYTEKNERKFYFNDFLKNLHHNVINYNNISIPTIQYPYIEQEFIYKPIPNNTDYIKGYFQSYKYFHHNYNQINKLLNLNSYLNNPKYLLDFSYISIHFRLGDYINLPDYHNVLHVNYYINALKNLKDKIGDDIYNHKILIFGEKSNDDIINTYIQQLDNKLSFIKILIC